MYSVLFAVVTLFGSIVAHDASSRSQKPIVSESANWMTKHMAEEHHIADFDADSFFTLHDFDADGVWSLDEMQRLYGLHDESNAGISATRRAEISQTLLNLLDTNRDGVVSRWEFVSFMRAGRTLPDLGTGPGHHGDDEYEYEIHHWEKYHDENTQLEDLTHPEDIEHFRKHEMMEDEAEKVMRLNRMAIVEANIPFKFRRQGS